MHVIGAGTMGGDIAAWLALHDCRVTLVDERPEAIASTLKRARRLFERRLKRPARVTAALDRLIPDPQGRGAAGADVVIEAIVEDLEAKRGLFATLEPQLRDDAVLATNTSSLPLEQLADGPGAAGPPGRAALLQSGREDAAGRDRRRPAQRRRGARSRSGADGRGGQAAAAREERPRLPGQPPADALHAEGGEGVRRRYAARDHRRGREAFRHAHGPAGIGRCRRPRHLRRRWPTSIGRGVRPRDPATAASAAPRRGDLGRKSGNGFYRYDSKGQAGQRQKQKP
ncbi:MAG: 3-hydroxyacyl-CoA dehydrogenase NAD-binding domain-containing protein [Halofilum sp. (in: g-proteobacteria)]|nr:3-hydroxyacyl-CoA dehydrogenase NAD-binding domain-containing protein [Halofilum sp. (in: g-proteobacteria)]